MLPSLAAGVAPWKHGVVLLAAVAGGFVNAIAGGGSLLTFPTLVWVGVAPVSASATNTVGLWPGSFGGVVGFRRHLPAREVIVLLGVPSLIGGSVGAVLLLHTPQHIFEALAPGLVLGATVLLGLQEPLSKRLSRGSLVGERSARFTAAAVLFQLVVGIYGGFFGAGIGIMMLAALAILGLTDIHQMNGLKNLLAIAINGVAAAYFATQGAVLWTDAALMAAGSIGGGFGGAALAQRLGRRAVRQAVIAIGVLASFSLLIKFLG
ncbi:MAG TPA: sulfite exporter TauE/SafE family protein [Acidimicrobiia bacterium]|nr:sulfite exporter TauE/SafE family protein [Acidimicrobiia bacterium]